MAKVAPSLTMVYIALSRRFNPTLIDLMKPRSPDPVLQSAWREAMMVFAIWAAAGTWCVGYAALYGYGGKTADIKYVLGFPEWIFWGVVIPWVTCVTLSAIVSQFLMRDEDLGIDPDEAMKEIIGEDTDA